MGACIWGISFLACGSAALYHLILGAAGISGMAMWIIGLIVSCIVIYVLGMMLGRVGGVLLMVVGALGALFTLGATLIITVFGFVLTFIGKPKLLVGINIVLYMICMACYAF
jgi:hypothetical protein